MTEWLFEKNKEDAAREKRQEEVLNEIVNNILTETLKLDKGKNEDNSQSDSKLENLVEFF